MGWDLHDSITPFHEPDLAPKQTLKLLVRFWDACMLAFAAEKRGELP